MAVESQYNNKSIVSLTLGILSIFIPFLGLIFGIIGLVFFRLSMVELKQTNEPGNGLAVSGMICSIVGIAIQLFAIISIILFMSLTSNIVVPL